MNRPQQLGARGAAKRPPPYSTRVLAVAAITVTGSCVATDVPPENDVDSRANTVRPQLEAILEKLQPPDTFGTCNLVETLRVTTSNIGHYDLEVPGHPPDPPAECFSGFLKPPNRRENFIVAQAQSLKDLHELSNQANVFAIQEMSKDTSRSCFVDWPELFNNVFGDGACEYSNLYSGDTANDGQFGNLLLYNADSTTQFNVPLNDTCQSGRTAHAVKVNAAGVDIWIINTHFKPCVGVPGPDNDDFTENKCNLDSLLGKIDLLDEESVVIVTGDLNIHRNANQPPAVCVGPTFHSERYVYMQTEFGRRGFMHVLNGGVDHVFVRDPRFVLKGISSVEFHPIHEFEFVGSSYQYSDPHHQILVTDLQLVGEGISPAFIPHLVTL